ncbi:hypothetical protein CHELA40_14531 [Chelatococcus asaccharovorans]|nr:hypothetical protein CHELA40_14531 [Chelatococcus asaccharovorans]
MRGLADRFNGPIDHIVGKDDLDFHFGQKINDILGATVEFRMTLLSAEALGLYDGDALQAKILQRFLHLVELEGLDDRINSLHPSWPPCAAQLLTPNVTKRLLASMGRWRPCRSWEKGLQAAAILISDKIKKYAYGDILIPCCRETEKPREYCLRDWPCDWPWDWPI